MTLQSIVLVTTFLERAWPSVDTEDRYTTADADKDDLEKVLTGRCGCVKTFRNNEGDYFILVYEPASCGNFAETKDLDIFIKD